MWFRFKTPSLIGNITDDIAKQTEVDTICQRFADGAQRLLIEITDAMNKLTKTDVCVVGDCQI